MSRRVSTAIAVFFAVLATTSTAPADDSPTESFWYVPQGNIEQAPRALSPAEEAKRAYETAARNAEEARIANEAGLYYNATEGLLWAHVRCTPVCGVWRVMVAPATAAAAAAVVAPRAAFHGLAAISPHYVGARPEQASEVVPTSTPRGCSGSHGACIVAFDATARSGLRTFQLRARTSSASMARASCPTT